MPATSRTSRTRRPPRRRRALLHGSAGFTIGLLAAVSALVFTGEAAGDAPVSAAATHAAEAAAVRIALDPAVTPLDIVQPTAEAVVQRYGFRVAGEDVAPRGATRIVVPAVGIDAEVRPVGFVFRDGALQYDVPRLGAGHYAGTAAPGDAGNAVIGGHVSTRSGGAVFAALPGVSAGDVVEVYRGDEVFRYSITEIRVVAADATTVMRPTHDATLTLITCFPEERFRQRLVVVGKLIPGRSNLMSYAVHDRSVAGDRPHVRILPAG